jgi:hypothetical protein
MAIKDTDLISFKTQLSATSIKVSKDYLIYYYCSYYNNLRIVPVTLTEKIVYRHLHSDIVSYKFHTLSIAHQPSIDYNIFSNTSYSSKWCVFYNI